MLFAWLCSQHQLKLVLKLLGSIGWQYAEDFFLSSLTKRVRVDFVRENRGDSSLSVLLMVPLTTQQLLHLAVGLDHTPQRDTHAIQPGHALNKVHVFAHKS